MVSPDNGHAANIEYLMKYVWKVKFENVMIYIMNQLYLFYGRGET